jgi:Ca2+-binding RTX toxin-like protein
MVTVTGVDDLLVDGNVAYSIVTAAALSSDSNYNGLNVADVNVTNQDNDPSRRPSRPVPPAGGPTPPAPPTNPILRAFAVQSDFIAVTTSADDGMNSGFRALPNAVMGTIGVDTLRGSLGDDVIIGLQGSDVLEGLLGADKFVYQANSDSSDTIVDFNKEQGDRIVLAELLRGNRYNGNSPITDEYIRFSPASNGGSFLQVDPDGVNPGQPINLVYFPGLTVSQLADPSIYL